MKSKFLIVLLLFFFSCDTIVKKKVSTNEILQEELETFNWNDVDVYPSFSSCDDALSKEDKKVCFQNTLSSFIFENISKDVIVVTQSVNDTVLINFEVSKEGALSILDISSKAIVKEEIPKLDSLIYKALDSLPRIFPATKRGQQVNTQFKLPIVVKVS